MSFWQTASLVETGPTSTGDWKGVRKPNSAGVPLLRSLLDALVSLVHVLDVSLEKKKVGRRLAVDL